MAAFGALRGADLFHDVAFGDPVLAMGALVTEGRECGLQDVVCLDALDSALDGGDSDRSSWNTA